MSLEENERDNDNIKENNQNLDQSLDELTKLTNFTFGQINNFRKYFRKCKLNSDSNGNSDLLNKQEFIIL